MVLVPNTRTPQRIGDASDRRRLTKFKVFYDFQKPTITGITVNPETLFGTVYQEYALIPSNVYVTFTYAIPKRIDTMILGKCNAEAFVIEFYSPTGIGSAEEKIADGGSLNAQIGWTIDRAREHLVASSGSNLMFNPIGNDAPVAVPIMRQLAPGANRLDDDDQEIIIYSFPEMLVSSIQMAFTSTAPMVELHKLLFCMERTFPEPKTFKYPMSLQSTANYSVMNIVYGKDWPTTRSLEMSWDPIDDLIRRDFERYVTDMQTFKPHFILPMSDSDYYLPPLFAALTKADIPNGKRQNVWHWDGVSLSYKMAG